MRFGVLFVGYVLLFLCKSIDIFPDFIAYLVMFAAMLKLCHHNKYFNGAKYFLIPTVIIAGIHDTFLFFKLDYGDINTIVSVLNNVFLIVYHYFLYNGIEKLAREVKIESIAKAAVRNLYIGLFYTLFSLILQLNLPIPNEFKVYIGWIYIFMGLIWIILTSVMIFRCYMWICLEGDEDMPKKEKNKIKKE
ncbi:MAG: hypothetical protein FWF15_02845 [Oscillospiraceae bacterium]|nr:hypothetical protein [Oscillospiraceae bacterium]